MSERESLLPARHSRSRATLCRVLGHKPEPFQGWFGPAGADDEDGETFDLCICARCYINLEGAAATAGISGAFPPPQKTLGEWRQAIEDRLLADVRVENFGLYAEHNMPCPICLANPAVFDCQRSFFSPCWGCQKDGWRTQRKRWPRV